MNKLSKAAQSLLQDLRDNADRNTLHDEEGTWQQVYLPNAQSWRSAKSFAGLLGSLKEKGLYRPVDDSFGDVKI